MFLLYYFTIYLFASAIAMERPHYHLEKAEEYFEDFIKTHGKIYTSVEEKRTRFEIFKDNLKHINHLNSMKGSIHGVTQFADLKKEEFEEQYNSCFSAPKGVGENTCTVITDAQINTKNAPPTLDYRQRNAVSAIKNQNPCHCCWAFATVGSLEGTYGIRHGQLLSLSAQQLMDCLACSGHCAVGGQMTLALSELTGKPGVMSDLDYPYAGRDLQCQFNPSKAKVKVTGCLNFNLQNEDKLKEALATYGPIAIAINSEPISSHAGGSIISGAECPVGRLGHAVLLVGYGTEGGKDYWLIKNSWGTAWGDQGYAKFARGQNVCGMMNVMAAVGTIG